MTNALKPNAIVPLNLKNEAAPGRRPALRFTNHPYRHVFLYACCTGKGSMCRAFGIPKARYSVGYFSDSGLRARAFIGSKGIGSTSIPFMDPNNPNDPGTVEADKLNEFFTRWRLGDPVGPLLESIKQVEQGNQTVQPGIDPLFVIYGATDKSISLSGKTGAENLPLRS